MQHETNVNSQENKEYEGNSAEECECMKIVGHLEEVKWLLWPREYTPSRGHLAIADFTHDPHIWLHYVESNDGLLAEDDVLRSTDTKYWSIHDIQRYYLSDLHCERVLFTLQYPNLRMPTRLGSYFWRANTATKLPGRFYHKEFVLSLEFGLKKMEDNQDQMDRIIISDQLIKVHELDYFKRQKFFRILADIISLQNHLQLVSFENLCCKRLEGVRLIQQLATFNADTLKYLFLWRFVLPNENPILINYSYITGSGEYIPRPDSKPCFLRSLATLKNLRVLALEYAHIADSSGSALITLLPVLKRPHFRLQLICREDHVPGYTDAALGAGGHDIPDTAWRKVNVACPDIYLFMAFFRIRDYDNVRRFLTPSIPLRETHFEFGIDLKMKQRQDSDVGCFVRHIAFRYANTLTTLSIHQWQFAIFSLRYVFELMPFLVRFYYVGRVADEVDLHRMLQKIACVVHHKLKHVQLQIEDEGSRREYWKNVVESLMKEYKEIMDLQEINLCISIYKN